MTIAIKAAAFLMGSVGLVWVSRASLADPRAHGFYRFFAWEAILALVLLNLEHWFQDPFGPRQLISWFLLMASIFLVIQGVRLLRLIGKPSRSRQDKSLLGIEKTTELVTTGAYRHIRHPLYSSLLFLTWGALLKHLSWPGLGLALAATVCLTLTARIEESENLAYFGTAYRTYRKRTKMFIPFLF